MLKSNLPSGSSSDIRIDGNRDMVQVYDPYKKEWKDWEQTGAIILPSTITITTTTLSGQPVTCVLGDYSQTTVFVDGTAVFQDIFTTGTATITSGEYSMEVEVTETGGSYEGMLEEVVDLVLWDGSTRLNGATDYNGSTSGYGLSYSCTSGEIDDRKFNFITASSYSGSNCQIYLTVTSANSSTKFYLANDGVFSSSAVYLTTTAGEVNSYILSNTGITEIQQIKMNSAGGGTINWTLGRYTKIWLS